jgi:hypothetical protein
MRTVLVPVGAGALDLSGSGAAQAARIVNVGRVLGGVMHEVILRV